MPWIRRVLRGNTVYVRSDAAGQPLASPDGRVDVVYRPAPGAKVYRASLRNLATTGDPGDEQPVELNLASPGANGDTGGRSGRGGRRTGAAQGPGVVRGDGAGEAAEPDAIVVYTDGACSGNPGPMGIGVVILDRGKRRELSEYLGEGTNNIAELTAILRALEAIPEGERGRQVLVHSDSSYALGLLGKGWKAKKNVELVASLRKEAQGFPRLRLVKVPGHSGVPENERCDQLANQAVARGR